MGSFGDSRFHPSGIILRCIKIQYNLISGAKSKTRLAELLAISRPAFTDTFVARVTGNSEVVPGLWG